MESFESIISALQNKFDSVYEYMLDIEYSELRDLDTRKFNELGFPIVDLKLTNNNLRYKHNYKIYLDTYYMYVAVIA